VQYWEELVSFFERIKEMDAGMLSLCWGAMASLWHFHRIPKHLTVHKQFGVIQHFAEDPSHPLLHGIPREVGIPVSRHTTWKEADFEGKQGIQILLNSQATGPALVWDAKLRHAHMINHFEYDQDTLAGEYWRDVKQGTPTGEPIHLPLHYFPQDNPTNAPPHTWKAPGQNFYSNWVQTLLRGGDGRVRGR
jgi:homoserine O-succinyltransferase